MNQELQRVLDLPVLDELTPEWIAEVTHERCPAGAVRGKFKGLNGQQALALETFASTRSAFVLCGVGVGKTAIAYGCAQIAVKEQGHERVLILTPNNVITQFLSKGRREAAEWLGFKHQIHTTSGKSVAQRNAMAKLARPGVYILPYSHLSLKDTAAFLAAIKPTAIICDEAHRLRNARAAGSRRLFSYIKTIDSEFLSIAFLSGTMTRRGLKDYFHLAAVVLGGMSPLPLSFPEAQRWGAVIDAKGSSFQFLANAIWDTQGMIRELTPLVDWAKVMYTEENLGEDKQTQVRRAFNLRLTSTLGVISSPPGDLPCPLIIDNIAPGGIPDNLAELMYGVQHLGVTPSGDEIEFALHKYKWMLELSAGFYNDLRWPDKIASDRVDDLARSQDHHEALQRYHKLLRVYLDFPKDGLDTPFLVGSHFRRMKGRGQLAAELYRLWKEAKELADFQGLIERKSVPVRVSPYKVDALAKWAVQHANDEKRGALVWVGHNEMRVWAAERLKAEGLDVLDCPSGDKRVAILLTETEAIKTPERFYVLNYNGWREGLDLQWGSTAAFLQWPRGEDVVEQAIGRQHRQGQEEDEVTVYTLLAPERDYGDEEIAFDQMLFAATLVDSLYVQQTTRSSRRLMSAAFVKPPHLYPPQMLAERIPNVAMLTDEQQRELLQRFAQ